MKVLLDTGPLVALINPNEHHHQWVVEQANQLAPPFFTCDAVLTEAHFVLGTAHNRRLLLNLLDSGRIDPSFSYREHISRVNELIRTYENVPASFADVCLVCMAEHYPDGVIFTLDSDFTIYRKRRNQRLEILMP